MVKIKHLLTHTCPLMNSTSGAITAEKGDTISDCFSQLSEKNIWVYIYLFLIYFIDYAIQLSHFFSPLLPSALYPLLPSFPHLNPCPWVIHTSSLASPFLILFFTSPCLFCTYHLCYLFPVPFPLILPCPLSLITLHVISISVVLFLF